jgi:hypothetical protein
LGRKTVYACCSCTFAPEDSLILIHNKCIIEIYDHKQKISQVRDQAERLNYGYRYGYGQPSYGGRLNRSQAIALHDTL